MEVVLGEASGIPANPTVKDGPGAGDVAVKPCYPYKAINACDRLNQPLLRCRT